jgi:hypothetical protein
VFAILYLILRGIGGDGTDQPVPSTSDTARRDERILVTPT